MKVVVAVQISIVLPVYNGEQYLAETLESIRQQTYRDFEVLCIDDASLDGSAAILEDFAARDKRFKLLRRSANGGSAVKCIKNALPSCSGEYYFYCSQDDLLSRDCLEEMHRRALETNADAVLPDMAWHYETNVNPDRVRPPGGSYGAVLSGQQAFMLSLDWRIHGFSLRKMDLVRSLGFDDSFINGDEYASRLFYLNCDAVAFSAGTFFYRQDNPGALTKRFSASIFEYFGTDIQLLDLMRNNGVGNRYVRRYALGIVRSLGVKQRLLQTQGHQLSSAQSVIAQGLMDAVALRLKSLSVGDRIYIHMVGHVTKALRPIRSVARSLKGLIASDSKPPRIEL
jgi:glycosyltransferase involved in cell wall biosynthesis